MIFNNPSFDLLSSKEWLITNGIGGYASGSLSGANTRRYHGLLAASFNPPTDRRVLVANIDENIISAEETFSISSNQYPDTIYPDGFRFLKSFERVPFPKWVFENKSISITKGIFMIYGRNITVIEYKNSGINAIQIKLKPLLVYRDYHHLMSESDIFDFKIRAINSERITVQPAQGFDPYFVYFDKGSVEEVNDWYRNFEYIREIERGLDIHEDAKCVFEITINLDPGESSFLIFSADEHLPEGDPSVWKKHEELRLVSLTPSINNKFLQDLVVSGDQFLVWRLSSKNHTLIAGYHWFTDWGRDTMIAMRGLVIATGKKEIAKSILLTFINYLEDGLIPNRFPDQGEKPEYNTIDATLWLFIALYEYDQKFDDTDFIEKVFPYLRNIIDHHYSGTKYNIHVTNEGLLYGGEKEVQLTWMDAKVGNHVVTPRRGCAVEINALWYNALCILNEFGKLLGENTSDIHQRILFTKQSFNSFFLNDKGYLNDVIIPDQFTDDAIRPNQIYAISLPFTPLAEEACISVLKTVEVHLYTDLGLRSLSPFNQQFRPVYHGGQWERDHAYHQGTVWAYLWGEYALAYMKVHRDAPQSGKWVIKKSAALQQHFYNENGIYAISEVFDGADPVNGKGCIHQAWSIGMTIKALLKAVEVS